MSDMSDDDMNIEEEPSFLGRIPSPTNCPRVSSPTPSTSTDSTDSADSQDDEVLCACIICRRKFTVRKCALCNDALICSMNCQEVAVHDDTDSRHFAICVSKIDTSPVLRTAKTFYKNVLSNKIPPDMDTFNDYQFFWLGSLADQRKLLKIYATLISMKDVTPRELDIWVKERTLFERISMLFHCFPELISLEDLLWLKASNLWTAGLGKTARVIFEDLIARKQEKVQSD
ncbi:hypothetical protein CGCSCA4_v006907 [Colletotrichum siamense]|uniref:Suppressor of anucleate metulae protein B n=1 Tax=Colletotrichum siamense TaxID=690259 RepID=A0A9P5EV32_COLSI|nr:hypothetical protein CGCSCA4_v006907 [Colletotrichum siamense]KAF4859912.1 hypothetical protein CGCSCA2_v006032 [Colletotrichum siamense]